MLKVKNLRLLLITILMVTLVCMSSSVFATNGVPTIGNVNNSTSGTNGIPSIGNINNGTTNNTNTQIVAPSLNTSNNTNNTTNNTNRNNSNSSVYDSNLPKTGIDYSVLFIIGIFAIVAVYAYIKIRKYNNVKY